MSLENKLRQMSKHGIVSIHSFEVGSRCVAEFQLGDMSTTQDINLKVTALGCSSADIALDLIDACIWLPAPKRVPPGHILLGDQVFNALRKMFPSEDMDINIYGPPWRVEIEYRRKDPGRIQDDPIVLFDYRFNTKSDDFGEIARAIFSQFKIPAEGVLLGPVGTSHISIGT